MSIGEGRRFFILIDTVLTEVLSCKQAAYHYNLSIRTIQRWIDEEKLFATDFEGRWWIPKDEIENVVKTLGYNHKLMAE
jgi:hypothetical protein